MTETEPEWDEGSRADVLALVALGGMTHTCGQPTSEAVRFDNGPPLGHGYRVHGETCEACAAIATVKAAHHATHKDKKGACDCAQRVWWAERIPLPGSPT